MSSENLNEKELNEAFNLADKEYSDYKKELLLINKLVSILSLFTLISVSFHLVLTIILWSYGY